MNFNNNGRDLWRWLRAGASTAFFRSPRWDGLAHTDANLVLTLVLLVLSQTVIFQRLYVQGPAQFYWQAIAYGWLPFALLPFYALLVRGTGPSGRPGAAPDLAALVTMLLSQTVWLNLLLNLFLFSMWAGKADKWSTRYLGPWGAWILWGIPVTLFVLSQLTLLARAGRGRRWPLAVTAVMMAGVVALGVSARHPDFWYPEKDSADNEDAPERYLKLTAEMMEAQPALLSRQLAALAPQRPGKVDMYALTFAPYGDEVFRRESQMVADVMSARFDTGGRTVQFVNHVKTADKLPWATTLNLRRAIRSVARTMDKDEDVLFVYLTSHGAREGRLAADFWPFELTELTPAMLRKFLDDAGIKHRVIAVSACYSGSWIPALKDDATMVLTAADANHTSYGCGYKSELTYFGRAMFDEQLRSHTRSFEEAHAAAREVIRKREIEAGKDDGYSNPQLSVGPAIRAKLAAFQ
ncbi:C13 family peptidase [Pseudoduganella violaceinigra]|uniref:C13 family peptidase n=1 Tax=Pseudoduganella violaceinigra TaxID=246602 RepID=UPI00042205B3|nr:C13 family peptidase [Pseudoduganella violaceinigra]